MKRHGIWWPTLVVGPVVSFLIVVSAPALAKAQDAYKATFTLGIQGRSGCLVCHSDRNMAKMTAGKNRSFYISEGLLEKSAHHNISCIACHSDFSYGTPHSKEKPRDWKEVASDSCKNCHRNAYQRFISSPHASTLPEGKRDPKKPLCATCHGSHLIGSATERGNLGLDGMKTCGSCHKKWAASYSDYYHGAAYKNGAPDAPACWECHGSHEIAAVKSKNPRVKEMDLTQACGQCHAGVTEDFLSYTPLVHGTDRIRQENLLWRSIRPLTDWLSSTKDVLMSVVQALF